MARARNWDLNRRTNRAWLHGTLPAWHDGWAPTYDKEPVTESGQPFLREAKTTSRYSLGYDAHAESLLTVNLTDGAEIPIQRSFCLIENRFKDPRLFRANTIFFCCPKFPKELKSWVLHPFEVQDPNFFGDDVVGIFLRRFEQHARQNQIFTRGGSLIYDYRPRA